MLCVLNRVAKSFSVDKAARLTMRSRIWSPKGCGELSRADSEFLWSRAAMPPKRGNRSEYKIYTLSVAFLALGIAGYPMYNKPEAKNYTHEDATWKSELG